MSPRRRPTGASRGARAMGPADAALLTATEGGTARLWYRGRP
jgi:hypothetical protein